MDRKRFVVAVLFGYFGLGMLNLHRGEFEHVFPFHAWDMFAEVKHVETHYLVRVSRWAGEALAAPKTLSTELCRPTECRSVRTLVVNMGEAHAAGDLPRYEANRRLLEERYIRPPAAYALFALTGNSLALYRGEAARRRQIGEFEVAP